MESDEGISTSPCLDRKLMERDWRSYIVHSEFSKNMFCNTTAYKDGLSDVLTILQIGN